MSFRPEELVKLFLSKLPLDIKLRLTNDGNIHFKDWEDAKAALSKLAEPICAMQADDRRSIQTMAEAFKNQQTRLSTFNALGAQANTPTVPQNRPSLLGAPGAHSNPRVFRCGEYQGIGHRDVNCPLRQPGHVPKTGILATGAGVKIILSRTAPRGRLDQLLRQLLQLLLLYLLLMHPLQLLLLYQLQHQQQ